MHTNLGGVSVWNRFDARKEQRKEMCATCMHGGRIVDYVGRGKNRRMFLWCEKNSTRVHEEHICVKYTSHKGKTIYPY